MARNGHWRYRCGALPLALDLASWTRRGRIEFPCSLYHAQAHCFLTLLSLSHSFRNYLKMKHLAAYLLLKLGGNDSPSADDVKKALATVGVEVEGAKLTKMMADLEGKDLSELMSSGKDMLATFGAGGGGGGGGAGGDAGGAAAAEEKEEAVEEEEVDVGGGNLFGGDDEGGGDY